MRKVVFIISLIFCFFIYLVVINLSNNKRDILENSTNDQIIKSDALTMMYETDVGRGEYQVSTDSEWLGDEYIFNETLSKCENGGTLSWNNDTQRIVMQTNSSDKCYIYFDKYNMPQVTEVTATEVTSNSITVSVTASGGDGSIVSYHYSIDDGEYISSNSNSYTFENLNAETSYDISVYVSDSNERDSNVYNVDVKTNSNLISFILKDNYTSTTTTYYAEVGMTWYEWVNSEYSDGNFATACSSITGVVLFGSQYMGYMIGVNEDETIVNNSLYDYYGFGTKENFSCGVII